jgi:hypothetical protein
MSNQSNALAQAYQHAPRIEAETPLSIGHATINNVAVACCHCARTIPQEAVRGKVVARTVRDARLEVIAHCRHCAVYIEATLDFAARFRHLRCIARVGSRTHRTLMRTRAWSPLDTMLLGLVVIAGTAAPHPLVLLALCGAAAYLRRRVIATF